jgi:hypothetical protein
MAGETAPPAVSLPHERGERHDPPFLRGGLPQSDDA